MNNLRIWEQVDRPPKDALKTISSGSLKGMTDISPLWRIKKMTEVFGPCGIGWGYVPEKFWSEPGFNQEVLCFCQVKVWYKDKFQTELGLEKKTGEVYGVGGSKLLHYFGTQKYHTSNDEGYKMALTDAISVACKSLGVGADIYAGKWDGLKYIDEPSPPKDKPKGNIEKALTAVKAVKSQDELNTVEKRLELSQWTEEEIFKIEASIKEMRSI